MTTRTMGEPIPRREDPRLVAGDGRYLDDLGSGALAAAFVRSPHAAARILDEDVLDLRGLHSHIGSQIFDTSGFEVAARRVLELQAQIRDARGVELPELDLGGGFGIAYTTQESASGLPAGERQLNFRLAAVNLRDVARGARAFPRGDLGEQAGVVELVKKSLHRRHVRRGSVETPEDFIPGHRRAVE